MDLELRYNGDQKNGVADGYGTLARSALTQQGGKWIQQEAKVYVGHWRNGLRHGNGTEFSDGIVFSGTWKDGKKDGLFTGSAGG